MRLLICPCCGKPKRPKAVTPFSAGPLAWAYGSGFPKSHNISKAIDRQAGAEREVVKREKTRWTSTGRNERYGKLDYFDTEDGYEVRETTAPATPEAQRWDGYGTALKPAWEPIIAAMKPLDGTFAANALAHGVAGINVDAGRVGNGKNVPGGISDVVGYDGGWGPRRESDSGFNPNVGRWPPNVALTHLDGCRKRGVKRVSTGTAYYQNQTKGPGSNGIYNEYGVDALREKGQDGYADPDGTETVTDWDCVEGCPVAMLDEMSGELSSGAKKQIETKNKADGVINNGRGFNTSEKRIHGPKTVLNASTGGASRFFYTAKAHRLERSAGLPDGMTNDHPTVKPIALCKWIAGMLLPPPGDKPRRLLVPFGGVASEAIGAALAGWDEIIAVEMTRPYVEIGRTRVDAWLEAVERTGSTDVDTLLDYFRGAQKARQERQERVDAGQLPLPLGGAP